MNLLRHIQIVHLSSEGGADKSTEVSRHIDMANWEGVVFMVVGTSDTHCATTAPWMSVQGCSSTTLTSFSTYKIGGNAKAVKSPGGTAVAVGAKSKRIPFVIDVYRPTKRYIRAQVCGFSSGPTEIIGLCYGSRNKGTSGAMWTNDTAGTVWLTTVAVSPTT